MKKKKLLWGPLRMRFIKRLDRVYGPRQPSTKIWKKKIRATGSDVIHSTFGPGIRTTEAGRRTDIATIYNMYLSHSLCPVTLIQYVLSLYPCLSEPLRHSLSKMPFILHVHVHVVCLCRFTLTSELEHLYITLSTLPPRAASHKSNQMRYIGIKKTVGNIF